MTLASEMLLTTYAYGDRSMERLFECAAKVNAEQYVAPTRFGRSLHETLFHTLSGQVAWRSAFETGQPHRMNPLDFPTLESIRVRWEEEGQAMQRYIASLEDEGLRATHTPRGPQGNEPILVWHMLMHLALHGMQHRAEAAHMLTEYGHSPSDLDFIFLV